MSPSPGAACRASPHVLTLIAVSPGGRAGSSAPSVRGRLAFPQARRASPEGPGLSPRVPGSQACTAAGATIFRSAGRALACPENCRALRRRWGPAGGPFRVVVSRATSSQGCARSCGLSLCGSRACECPHAREEPGFPPLLLFFKLCKSIILYYALILTFTACVL